MNYDNNKLNERAEAHFNGIDQKEKLMGAFVNGVREAFENPELFTSNPLTLQEGQAHDTFLKDIAEQKYPQLEGGNVLYNHTQKEKQIMFIEGMQHVISNPQIFHLCNKTKEEGITGEDNQITAGFIRLCLEGAFGIEETSANDMAAYIHGKWLLHLKSKNTAPKKEEGEDIRKEAYTQGWDDRHFVDGGNMANQFEMLLGIYLKNTSPTLPSTTENKGSDRNIASSVWDSLHETNDHGFSGSGHNYSKNEKEQWLNQRYPENNPSGIDKEEEMVTREQLHIIANIERITEGFTDDANIAYTSGFIKCYKILKEGYGKSIVTPLKEKDNTVTEGKEDKNTAIELIASERQRQIEVEKYDISHDEHYGHGELVGAAMCYAAASVNKHYPANEPKLRSQVFVPAESDFLVNDGDRGDRKIKTKNSWEDAWPWDDQYDKRDKHDEIRCLVISCALLVAQIEKRLSQQK